MLWHAGRATTDRVLRFTACDVRALGALPWERPSPMPTRGTCYIILLSTSTCHRNEPQTAAPIPGVGWSTASNEPPLQAVLHWCYCAGRQDCVIRQFLSINGSCNGGADIEAASQNKAAIAACLRADCRVHACQRHGPHPGGPNHSAVPCHLMIHSLACRVHCCQVIPSQTCRLCACELAIRRKKQSTP